MKQVRFTLSIGYPAARRTEVLEFEDDTTDEDIEQAYTEWDAQYIDGGWTTL